MGWPLSQDYNEAVQSPRASFSDPDLKGGEVVVGPMGLPLPRSGNFADVYQLRGADGRMWAVKCFTRPVAGLGERYSRIDEHLRNARLPFAVGFRFLPEGIRIRGQWYPVLKMEWVEGLTLNEFVRQQANKPEQLKALLGMWVRLCKRLRESKIAHADLQHGNVLLVPGETANKLKLRLIDYDGMWVPALAGKPSGEAGHPAYQNPARLQGRAYTAEVDRFPHLVIGCALRAVAVAGKPVWDQFDNGDNLLFREADFAEPAKSKVFRALWALDDPTITNLVALLAVCSRKPLKATPWLDDVLSGEKAEPVSDKVLAQAADLIGVEHRAARESAPVGQLYVVPEEANAFADLWSDDPNQQKVQPRRKVSLLPLAIAGGVAAIAAAVVIAILMRHGGDSDSTPAPPDPDTAKTTATTGEGPVPGKRGVLKTQWVALPAEVPAAGPKSLAEGLDGPRPGRFNRSYGTRGASSLGVWLMPDGARAVLARGDRISVIDLDSGSIRPTVQDIAPVRAAVTPDGHYAVIADKDRIIRCFDLRNGLEQFSREFPAEAPVLLITPDGKRVAMTAEGVGYTEWTVPDGKEVRSHESLQASLLSLTPDGTRAVAADKDGGIELWDLDEGRATILSPTGQASAVCMSADGTRSFVADQEGEIRVWDVKEGKPLPGLPVPVKQKVTALAATSDGTILVGSEGGQVAYIPATGTGGVAFSAPQKDMITGFSLTGDGKHAMVATEKMGVYLIRTRPKLATKYDLPDSVGFLDLVRSTTVPPEAAHIAVSSAAKWLLVATENRLIFHNLETFRVEKSFRLEDGASLLAVGFAPDGQVIVSQRAGEGNQTRVLNVKAGEFGPPFVVPGGSGSLVNRIVPVPRTKFVIATTDTTGDYLFDITTRKVADGWPAARSGDGVVAGASHDGKFVAVGSLVRPVQLFDTTTGTLRRPLEASAGFVRLAFTPDDSQLIGIGQWGRIRLWDVTTGKVVKDIAHTDPGPLRELVPLDDDLVAIGPAEGWMVLNLATGKLLGTGADPDPLWNRGVANAELGWILTVDSSNRLAAWKVNSERVANAPARPPREGEWPDAKLVRDAPRSAVVGVVQTSGGDAFVLATADRRITRYTADQLLYEQELDIDEGPARGLARVGDQLFVLGRRSVVVRKADDFEKVSEFPVTIPTGSNPIFAVRPDGTEFVTSTDKIRLTDLKTKRETVVNPPRAAAGKPLTHFVYAADGRSGVTRWGNMVTTVWHPRQTGDGKVLEELKTAVEVTPGALAITADGKIAVVATRFGEVRAWNTTTGKVVHSEAVYKNDDGQPLPIEALAMAPDGKHFLTAAADGRVTYWAVDGFTKRKEYKVSPGTWRATLAPNARTALLVMTGQMVLLELPQVGQ
jgi:WD40 repeat protein